MASEYGYRFARRAAEDVTGIVEYLAETLEKLVGNYVLFYQPDAQTQTIYILRVVHGRRDRDEVAKNLT